MVNRKASLQLSINAIVILILAITILGLGLGFIRNMFGSSLDQLKDVEEKIQIQIKDEIETSGKILTFDRLEINSQRGEEEKFYYGLKNTASEVYCFAVRIRCISSLRDSMPDICGYTASDDLVGGYEVDDGQSWFVLYKEITIEDGETQVTPILFQVSDVKEDTYHMRIEVFQSTTSGECDGSSIDTSADPYVKEDFHLYLS